MKVTCNNKYEHWCPYGAENCECDMYDERDLRDGECFTFTCTDIDDDQRKCNLLFIPENETELKVKKFVDMILHGIDVSEIPKKSNCNNVSLKTSWIHFLKQNSDISNLVMIIEKIYFKSR